MEHLAPHDVMVVFLALAALLASAKFAGELVKKFNQPSVLGEIIAGILLGPTVLGCYRPTVYGLLFPHSGPVALVLDGITAISVVFFLLTAGIEIDLASIFRQGKSALLAAGKLHADDTPVPVLSPGNARPRPGACGPTFAMIVPPATRRHRRCGLPTRRITKANIRNGIWRSFVARCRPMPMPGCDMKLIQRLFDMDFP